MVAALDDDDEQWILGHVKEVSINEHNCITIGKM